jgi:deazaflavin-dependent oxidoreductase (nitroreductase family)
MGSHDGAPSTMVPSVPATRRPPRSPVIGRILKIAGRRLRAYSIVTHVGRRSSRPYRNPVSAYPLGDGFVIAVLYGRESQWVRNVMASGSFTLRTKGRAAAARVAC